MKKAFLLAITLLALISCGSNSQNKPVDDTEPKKVSLSDSIVGNWIQADGENTGEMSDTTGFVLQKGGKAQSINMPTYQYQSWSLKNDTIIMKAVCNAEGLPVDTTVSDTGIVDIKANTITMFGGDIIYKRK